MGTINSGVKTQTPDGRWIDSVPLASTALPRRVRIFLLAFALSGLVAPSLTAVRVLWRGDHRWPAILVSLALLNLGLDVLRLLLDALKEGYSVRLSHVR